MYKCLNDLAPRYICSNFKYAKDVHNVNTRSSTNHQLAINDHCSIRSFQYQGAIEWNKLPLQIRVISSLQSYNPNSIRSYKIVQKLSPKHAARGIAQSPYPTYRHGKACLSKQPPWRAAGDPRLARGRSRVRAPGPAGALRAIFFLHPPFLPPSGDSFFRTFPTKPVKPVVRLGLRKLFYITLKIIL